MRRLHRYLSFTTLFLVCSMAITGAILSTLPAFESLNVAPSSSTATVADVAATAVANVPGIERLEQKASGKIIAYAFTDANGMQSFVLDPLTGDAEQLGPSSSLVGFFTELHRSLFLGELGRALAGIAAASMVVFCISGVLLLVKRCGGWSKMLVPAKGSLWQKLHVEVSRLSAAGLILMSITGIYMSLASFDLIGSTSSKQPDFPAVVMQGTAVPVGALSALVQTPFSSVRELVFPYPNDPSDVFTVKTSEGVGYVDQVSGEWLAFAPNSFGQKLYETFYMLHTGEGVWWFGLLMGVFATSIPLLAITGALIWWLGYKSKVRIQQNASLKDADVVIMVGSESNTTWGFARTLHKAIRETGMTAHTCDMNDLSTCHLEVGKLLVLTSTHGDGAAPTNADQFIEKIAKLEVQSKPDIAVVGFGDSGFAQFCQFAKDVETALVTRELSPALALRTIDKQCVQSFAAWGRDLQSIFGQAITLEHCLEKPKTSELALTKQAVYGTDTDQPVRVLRFEALTGRLPKFSAGDLVAVYAGQSSAPRYYSLASSSTDGFLEICVKRHSHGMCSGFLHELAQGDTIEVSIKPNPSFRMAPDSQPTIMIGAGTGIAPLIGLARANHKKQPLNMYWGGRHPNSDFLYEDTLLACTQDGRIASLLTAFSRIEDGQYVQQKLCEDAENIRSLVSNGARILICGGKDMADGVQTKLNEILLPIGTNVQTLKRSERYLEDVY